MNIGFMVYCTYVGIKNHFFTKSYDYWKYNRKVKVRPENFDNRRDRSFFLVIMNRYKNRYDLEQYFIANCKDFVKRNITEMMDVEAKERYSKHVKVIDALRYNLETDLKKINPRTNYVVGGDIFKDYMEGEVLLETICFFDMWFRIFEHWDKHFQDTLYLDRRNFLTKYKTYLSKTVAKDTLGIIKKLYYKSFVERS